MKLAETWDAAHMDDSQKNGTNHPIRVYNNMVELLQFYLKILSARRC